MDEIVYEALARYYHALELKGYMPLSHSYKLLVLSFYRDAILNDFMQFVTDDDKYTIEKALNCLYGTTCTIPYTDYLKKSWLVTGSNGEPIYPPDN